jgi:hypothetical protein
MVFTIVLTQIGLAEWLTQILKLPLWFEYIWKAIILVLGIEIGRWFKPDGSYPYGLFSLGFSLSGKDKVRYWAIFGLCFVIQAFVIKETYNLALPLKLTGFVVGFLILFLTPIGLYGTAEMKAFFRK